jgi:hypothetical protein
MRPGKYEFCKIFKRGIAKSSDVIEKSMVELLADDLERGFYLAQIAQPASRAVGLTAERYFDIKRMAMKAVVFRHALPQPMCGIEYEFLGQLDHDAACDRRVFRRQAQAGVTLENGAQ